MSLKIATYNVQLLPPIAFIFKNGFLALRSSLIANSIDWSDFDIVCFQELFESIHRDLIVNKLAEKGFEHVWIPPNSNLVFFGPGIVICSKHGFTHTNYTTFRRSFGTDWCASKGVVHVRVVVNEDTVVDVFNTHMQSDTLYSRGVCSTVRKEQIIQLKNFVKKHGSKDVPKICVGDLNIERSSDEYSLIASELGDLIDVVNTDTVQITCYGNFDSDNIQKESLDYILTCPKSTCKECGVHENYTSKFQNIKRFSDHGMVWADISF